MVLELLTINNLILATVILQSLKIKHYNKKRNFCKEIKFGLILETIIQWHLAEMSNQKNLNRSHQGEHNKKKMRNFGMKKINKKIGLLN